MDDEFDDILLDSYNIDTPNETADADNSNDETETPGTKRMPKQEFNDNLLLEPDGIPLLKHEIQYLTFSKKKGQEGQDLEKLMTFYAIWANNLYPGLSFKRFSKRVTTPANSRSIIDMMNVWSNEYRERRKVRLDVRNELSKRTVGDESSTDENQSVQADDESPEDDNRTLLFPPSQQQNKRYIVLDDSSDDEDTHNLSRSNSLALIIERKRKREQVQRAEQERLLFTATSRTIMEDDNQDNNSDVELALSDNELSALGIPTQRPMALDDAIDENEEIASKDDNRTLLFPPSQQQNKRYIVLDDSSDDEDTHNLSRSNALALIIERKRKREQVQRAEQERLLFTATSRTIMEDENQDNNSDVELALSDNELSALGIPTQRPMALGDAIDDENEDEDTTMRHGEIELALSDDELLALGLPVKKPKKDNAVPENEEIASKDQDVELALSDNTLLSLGLPSTTDFKGTEEDEEFSDNELLDIKEA